MTGAWAEHRKAEEHDKSLALCETERRGKIAATQPERAVLSAPVPCIAKRLRKAVVFPIRTPRA
jgi:hypothetical protein